MFHLKAGSFELSFGKKSSDIPYYRLDDGTHTYNLVDPNTIQKSYKKLFSFSNAEANLLTLFYAVPEIFAPINTIAEAVAKTTIEVRKIEDDSVVYNNKDLNRILSQPNPFYTFEELMYSLAAMEYLTGNTFLSAAVPDSLKFSYKNNMRLWCLPSADTEIVLKNQIKLFSSTVKSDVIQEYKMGRQQFTPEIILHQRSCNLIWDENMFRGKPKLLSGEYPLSNLIAVYQARNVIYVKQGMLGMIVSKKGDDSGLVALTTKEKDGIIEQMNDRYGITGNRSPVGITEAPVDFIKMGMTIAELQPFDETRESAAALYGILNVPWDLRPKNDGATYENQKSAIRRLYQDVIIPFCTRYANALSTFLKLQEDGLYLKPNFEKVEALQENKKENAEVDKTNVESNSKLYEKGLITKNEFRVRCGLESVDDWDTYISDEKNDTPLAVRLGVGGTQALQSILADNNLSEDQKKNTLMILFGLPEEQARVMSVGGGVNSNISNENQNTDAATA